MLVAAGGLAVVCAVQPRVNLVERLTMIIEKLMRKGPFQSPTLRAIAGGVLTAVVVSVGVAVGSSLLSCRTSPGVAAALAAAAGSAYLVGHRQR